MTTKTEVLVVDDHPLIGTAMEILLSYNIKNVVVEKVEGGKSALKSLKQKSYNLVILDVDLPDFNILNLIPSMFAIHSDLKILVYTMSPENILARRLFSLNIMGFLSKSMEDEEILRAVKTVLKGKKYISADFSEQVIGGFLSGSSMNPFEELSDREYQIMTEMLKGSTFKNISDVLHLHSSSVATYRRRIYDKLQVENHIELYRKARAFGIVKD